MTSPKSRGEYVDTPRPTDDPKSVHSAAVRTLVTSVRIPDTPGPFPLVVFAHGNSGHPRKVTQLLDAWARAGYVVAAPAFPLTNDDIDPTVIADYVEQPADLSRVIDDVLADSDADDGLLAGKVDAENIALAGHSLGGASVYGAAANTCCQDDRVDAVIELSGFRIEFPDGAFVPMDDLPLLAVHGSADPTIRLATGARRLRRVDRTEVDRHARERAALAAVRGPAEPVRSVGHRRDDVVPRRDAPWRRICHRTADGIRAAGRARAHRVGAVAIYRLKFR